VSRSGYYDYLKHQPSERAKANEQLQARCKDPSLGKVKRLMRREGIYSIVTPEFKPKVQEEQQPGLTMTNLLKQDSVELTTINQVWYVDITYIHTLEGWLFLAGVIDGFSKRTWWAMRWQSI
jgi:putative transposase